ncbi:MAG: 5-methylcytosine-specific restriction enzyme subunit McrC [Frankiaceae bacterium]|jgi:5-methylcytosine-specific restriction enzyme subunit McrC|nr:5-methylcytosine-specific restriction enzyme subunit McrC [Frankiaceae bacterium]
MTSVTVEAYATVECSGLSVADAEALAATRAVSVTRGWDGASWMLTAGAEVGVLSVNDVTVRIRPRIPIARMIFMLGYAANPKVWRDDPAPLDDQDELWPAMAHVFARAAERSLEQGLLQGYRTEESAQLVLRGRLREVDQLRRHAGLPVPLELRFDEYDVDIPENQLLRAATERLLRMSHVHPVAMRRLRHLLARLGEARRLVPGEPLPELRATRLNARYQPALSLARMILRARSVDVLHAGTRASGFLINMNTLFEEFVCAALTEALAPYGGRCVSQDRRHALDDFRTVRLRPDLVRYGKAGEPLSVLDAKYKQETPSGFPHVDLYQLLAYCTALKLNSGHLVYAEGHQQTTTVRIANADVTITRHALDLTSVPTLLLQRVAAIAKHVAVGPSSAAASP